MQHGRNTSTWKRLRTTILKRDDYTCAYCGNHANTVDHIIPIAHGGEDHPDNLISACHTCNSHKRDLTARFFLNNISTHLRPNKKSLSKGQDRTGLGDDVTVNVLDSTPFRQV